MTEDSSDRLFERTTSNMLPYRATISKNTAACDPAYSDPFVPDEIIAVRDEPNQPYFIARLLSVAAAAITVHYLGCTVADTARAVFRPGWHLENSNDVVLSDNQPPNHVPYVGSIDFDALRILLVARNLEFTKANRLRRKSQRALDPVKSQLFIF